MRIALVIPGSGGRFYCENCIRDNYIARALTKTGCDVRAVPMYLPPAELPASGRPAPPVFFGGINVHLQQKLALFRKSPRWIDRIFDAPFLLRWAARRAGSVRASALGETTLSVLKGPRGRQAKELERLIEWLRTEEKPDAVHLSNALLLGIGVEIKRQLGVPLVCSLQDEDTWIDAMEKPHADLCREEMSGYVPEVDAFVAVSRYYADVMRERMKIPAERTHVAYLAVEPEDFTQSPLPHDPPAIGYLARASPSLGLRILVEAYLELRKTARYRRLRLHLSGGAIADDEDFLRETRRTLEKAGADRDVLFFEGFDLPDRRRFFESIDVLSVPVPSGASGGMYLIESFASGVPVAQPRAGSFPEIVEATGGGVLYHPNDPETLAGTLGELLADRARLEELGRKGREGVRRRFTLEVLGGNWIEIYRGLRRRE